MCTGWGRTETANACRGVFLVQTGSSWPAGCPCAAWLNFLKYVQSLSIIVWNLIVNRATWYNKCSLFADRSFLPPLRLEMTPVRLCEPTGSHSDTSILRALVSEAALQKKTKSLILNQGLFKFPAWPVESSHNCSNANLRGFITQGPLLFSQIFALGEGLRSGWLTGSWTERVCLLWVIFFEKRSEKVLASLPACLHLQMWAPPAFAEWRVSGADAQAPSERF